MTIIMAKDFDPVRRTRFDRAQPEKAERAAPPPCWLKASPVDDGYLIGSRLDS
jgi:hypothetical protein